MSKTYGTIQQEYGTIKEYVRERGTGRGKQRVGVIVGTLKEYEINGVGEPVIVTGWSKANIKAGDEFDKETGIAMATTRALGKTIPPDLPPQMKEQMREFKIRCLRYFKQVCFMKTS